jgi:hypothetical protein
MDGVQLGQQAQQAPSWQNALAPPPRHERPRRKARHGSMGHAASKGRLPHSSSGVSMLPEDRQPSDPLMPEEAAAAQEAGLPERPLAAEVRTEGSEDGAGRPREVHLTVGDL